MEADAVALLNRDERKFVIGQPWYLIVGAEGASVSTDTARVTVALPHLGRAAKFADRDDQGLVEQATLLQIVEGSAARVTIRSGRGGELAASE